MPGIRLETALAGLCDGTAMTREKRAQAQPQTPQPQQQGTATVQQAQPAATPAKTPTMSKQEYLEKRRQNGIALKKNNTWWNRTKNWFSDKGRYVGTFLAGDGSQTDGNGDPLRGVFGNFFLTPESAENVVNGAARLGNGLITGAASLPGIAASSAAGLASGVYNIGKAAISDKYGLLDAFSDTLGTMNKVQDWTDEHVGVDGYNVKTLKDKINDINNDLREQYYRTNNIDPNNKSGLETLGTFGTEMAGTAGEFLGTMYAGKAVGAARGALAGAARLGGAARTAGGVGNLVRSIPELPVARGLIGHTRDAARAIGNYARNTGAELRHYGARLAQHIPFAQPVAQAANATRRRFRPLLTSDNLTLGIAGTVGIANNMSGTETVNNRRDIYNDWRRRMAGPDRTYGSSINPMDYAAPGSMPRQAGLQAPGTAKPAIPRWENAANLNLPAVPLMGR